MEGGRDGGMERRGGESKVDTQLTNTCHDTSVILRCVGNVQRGFVERGIELGS